MPKSPDKTATAKAMTLKYLRELYEGRRSGKKLTETDGTNISSQKDLRDHVMDLLDEEISGEYQISESTVENAIRELKDEGKIRVVGGRFEYVPPKNEIYHFFPLLRHPKEVTITELPVIDILFFRTNPYHAQELTDYINAHFYQDDIHAVCLGDIIMCLDYDLPESVKADGGLFNEPGTRPNKKRFVAKHESRQRILEVLSTFFLDDIKANLETSGATHDDLIQAALEGFNKQQEEERSKSGGVINHPKERNTKQHSKKT